MHDFPILLVGKTGTGKTLLMKKFLLNDLDGNKFIPTITSFSANTNSTQTQDILESKLEKQKRKKVLLNIIIIFFLFN